MPTHFKAHFNRGFAYDKLGNYDLAIKVNNKEKQKNIKKIKKIIKYN